MGEQMIVKGKCLHGDIEPMQNRLGNYLKEKREEKGWSQMKLAGHADIHATYVAQLERGKRKRVSLKVIKKMADALGLEIKVGKMGL